MFINDIHIFWYVGIGLLGFILGRFLDLVNCNLQQHKAIFSVDVFKTYLKTSKTNYVHMFIMCGLYILLLYILGFNDILMLIEYLILTPLLLCCFCIDCKSQIIPNRLTLTMLEIGLLFSFIRGIYNLNVAVEMWIGMLLGAGIFYILTFIGNMIFKKETMGFGDVKLMGALGVFFGWRVIIAVSILAFFIAAIYCIYLVIKKLIKKEELADFIPFGPFIVLASFVVMFVPFSVLIKLPFYIFTLGKN